MTFRQVSVWPGLSSSISGKKFYSEDELRELEAQLNSNGLKADDGQSV